MTSHDEIDIGMVVRLNDFVNDRIREQDCNVETHDASCHDTINNNLRRCSGTPQALGVKATSLDHKVAKLVFNWALGRSPAKLEHGLRLFTRSFFGYCTDMGTELGTTTYKFPSLTSLRPTRFSTEPLQADPNDVVSDVGDDLCQQHVSDAGNDLFFDVEEHVAISIFFRCI